jgi:class 3 adenylate cyclase
MGALMVCKNCSTENSDENKFCKECGTKLAEEVKEIMRGIFGASATIVKKYEGRIDKFIGDCVMAVFGIPRAHEDDALRAILAAMEIREAVDALNTPELEARIGTRLSMHTGVNTGIVVSGDLDLEKGSEKILGDTVNVAARLSGVAAHGEILVGRDTFILADRRFDFAEMPPVAVKGKAEPLLAYKVAGHRKSAATFRRLRGRKAEFVGRDGEIAELDSAAEALGAGKGAIVSVCGDAGSGKSRLVAEFKARVARRQDFAWHEAFANSQSENVAYSLWIDFMNRELSIEESDLKRMPSARS